MAITSALGNYHLERKGQGSKEGVKALKQLCFLEIVQEGVKDTFFVLWFPTWPYLLLQIYQA